MGQELCARCGKVIPRYATSCPACGASAKVIKAMARALIVILGGVGGLFLLFAIFGGGGHSGDTEYAAGSGPSGGEAVISAFQQKRAQCQSAVSELEAMDAVRLTDRDGYTRAEYDEGNWAQLEHVDRVRQALLVYCARMPDSGRYQVLIRGRHSGKMLASVTDGNYFDN